MTFSITTLRTTTLCHYVQCHCAECLDLFIDMQNVIMLSVIMLSVVMLSVAYLNVVMLTVIAPTTWPYMKMLFQPEKLLRVQKARLLVPNISKEGKSFYNINTWCLCPSFWLSQVRCWWYKPFYTCKTSFLCNWVFPRVTDKKSSWILIY